MKIFASLAPQHWLIWPDSTLLPSGRPLFIPDFAPEFTALPALAIRIAHVGKCIAPRFAHRYYESYSAALIIMPSDAFKAAIAGGLVCGTDLCFDNAIVGGTMQSLPLPAAGFTLTLRTTSPTFSTSSSPSTSPSSSSSLSSSLSSSPSSSPLALSSNEFSSFHIPMPEDIAESIAAGIAAFSRRSTIKTGDILLLPLSHPFTPLEGMQAAISVSNADSDPDLPSKSTPGIEAHAGFPKESPGYPSPILFTKFK